MNEFVSNIELNNSSPGVIKFCWTNPDKVIKIRLEDKEVSIKILGIVIVRRQNRYPTTVIAPHNIVDSIEYDGDMFKELEPEYPENENHKQTFEDKGLKSEIHYYYTLYTRYKDPATSLIYYYASSKTQVSCYAITNYNNSKKLYDLLPGIYKKYDAAGKDANEKIGPLERFLELFGQQFDYLQSATSISYKNKNIDITEGTFLKLFATWIGWKTNYRLDYSTQRNDIKNAPELYKTIGNKGNLAAYARYLTGSECRVKEFMHNVFITNDPERYYIRQCDSENGQWLPEKEPMSIDYAFEGNVSAIKNHDENLWIFYHANRTNQCNIWYKTIENDEWKPCTRLTNSDRIDRHPAAVEHNNELWVFWDSFDEILNAWQIRYKKYNGITWTKEFIFLEETVEESTNRRSPSVLVANNVLWIFWLEKTNTTWQFKYTKHNGNKWLVGKTFKHPGAISKDLFVLYSDKLPGKKIWAFWTQREKIEDETSTKEFWIIKYAWKEDTDLRLQNWSDAYEFPKFPEGNKYDDIEPVCTIRDDDHIKMFWSSNKNGSWSLFSSLLIDIQQNTWQQAELISRGPYNQRNPFIIPYENNLILGYRSNECNPYHSEKFKYSDKDFSPAGSIITEPDNIVKQSLKNSFDDFISYTYDTDIEDNDLFARDTLGVYLAPIQDIHDVINYSIENIRDILREFLPIQLRTLFFIETPVYRDVYNQDFPAENYFDNISDSFTEQKYIPTGYTREDIIPDWIWMYTADCINGKFYDNLTVDFDSLPLSTTYRTWHTGLKEKILWK